MVTVQGAARALAEDVPVGSLLLQQELLFPFTHGCLYPFGECSTLSKQRHVGSQETVV